jgi:putative endonuclease
MRSRARVELGKAGEDLACVELRRLGYAIIDRRFRTRVGEIDIVAVDRGTLVFVEVKTRRTVACGTPAEAVTFLKQRRMTAMAAEYLFRKRLAGKNCRFDVVAITISDGKPAIELFAGAFDAVF